MARFINKVSIDRYEFVLTDTAEAKQGELACGLAATGMVSPAEVAADQTPIGFFTEDMTGDGVAKVGVQLFQEVNAYLFTNDSGAPVANAFAMAYAAADAGSVSATETSNSAIGIAIEVSAAGVLVVPTPLGVAPPAAAGP